jgi:hypothetical protein
MFSCQAAEIKFEVKMDYTVREEEVSAAPVGALDLLNAIYTRKDEAPESV